MDLLDRLRLDVPVAQAGIGGGLPGPELAAAVAAADDTRAALAAGADGVVAGTRFLFTDEARAHPEYQRRILTADKTFRTMLFGLGWHAPHRVVANAATRRWCHDDGRARLAPRMINAGSGVLAKLPDRAIMPPLRMQTQRLPMFSPLPQRSGCPSRRWSVPRCTQVRRCCA